MSDIFYATQPFADLWAASLWRASWQGAVVLAIAWAIARWCTLLSPRIVCWIWRLACLKLLVAVFWVQPVELPVLPTSATGPVALTTVLPNVPPSEPVLAGSRVEPDARLTPRTTAPVSRSVFCNLLLAAWLTCVFYCITIAVRQWSAVRRVCRLAVPVASVALQQACRQEADRLAVRRMPRLQLSSQSDGPLLAGIWRPTIVFPDGVDALFDEAEIRLMLAHELAHLKRRDLLWNWLPTVVTWLFFFHPLVWVLRRRWFEAQEGACDELLIQSQVTRPVEYGRLLLKLSRHWPPEPRAALASAGILGAHRNLEKRVLAMTRVKPLARGTLLMAAGILALIATLGMIPWQLVAKEVAPQDRPLPHSGAMIPGSLAKRPYREQANAGPSVEGVAPDEKDDPGKFDPAQNYNVGDRIVVIHQSVPIIAGDKTVDLAYMGWIFTIDQIEGSRLWVPAKTPGWIEKQDTVPYESALAYFNDYLERNPTDKQARRARAMVLMSDGAPDAAISDFTEMLRLDSKDHTVWNDLGRAWFEKGDYDRAIANFSEAIRIGLIYAAYFHNRGEAWYRKGDAANAIKDWTSSLVLRPKYYGSQRQLAWLLATWPDERFRNGTEAVKRAIIACEVSEWRDVEGLETLAAAHAEWGDFGQAIRWQTKAIEMVPHNEDRTEAVAALELYKTGKPFRDDGTSDRPRLRP